MTRSSSMRCLVRVSAIGLLLLAVDAMAAEAKTAAADDGKSVDMRIPLPLTVSMDDAGWQGGSILNMDRGGPFRMGMERDPTLDDYKTLVAIAQGSGTRLQTLWVLSELDRSNLCAKPKYNLPIAPNDITEFGLNWDNSEYVNDGNFVLMDYVKDQAAWLELGLHGVRHEHWDKAGKSAQLSEFGQRNFSKTWGYATYINVLECFTELLRQYYDEETCSFPKSFIAPGHKYYYDESDLSHSTGAAVSSFGVKYTQRLKIKKDHFDGSLYATNRHTIYEWDGYGTLPADQQDFYKWNKGSYINTHPPNMFDPEKITPWIEWLGGINAVPGRYLPQNTVQTYSQILYYRNAKRKKHQFSEETSEGSLNIDNTRMPTDAYKYDILGTLCLKLESTNRNRFLSKVGVSHGAQVVAFWRDEIDQEYILIADPAQPMGRLEPIVYMVEYTLGTADSKLENVVQMEKPWTYYVSSLTIEKKHAELTVEMYGRQTVKLRIAKFVPTKVSSISPNNLILENWEWNATLKELSLDLRGKDIQGQLGTIMIQSTAAAGKSHAIGTLEATPDFAYDSTVSLYFGIVAAFLLAFGMWKRPLILRRPSDRKRR